MQEEILIMKGARTSWHPRFLGRAKIYLQQACFPRRDVENGDLKVLHLCLQSCQRVTRTPNNRTIPAIYSFLLLTASPYKMTSRIYEPVNLLVTGQEDIYLLDGSCNIIENMDCMFRMLIQYSV